MVWEAGKNFLMGQGIYYVMSGIGILGFLSILLLYVEGRLLSRKAQSPRQSKNGYIGLLCREFEKRVKSSGNVSNVDNFVNNYLSIHKFGPVSIISLEWFCGQLVYLCLLLGILCGGLGYMWKIDAGSCINIALFGAGIFVSLVCLEKMTHCRERVERAELYITAYLEDDVTAEITGREKDRQNNGQAEKSEAEMRRNSRARERRSAMLMEEVGNQAKTLVKINEAKELAKKTLEESGQKTRDAENDGKSEKKVEDPEDKGENKKGVIKEEPGLDETAATRIYPLERGDKERPVQSFSEKKDKPHGLSEKEEKIIADILREYAK